MALSLACAGSAAATGETPQTPAQDARKPAIGLVYDKAQWKLHETGTDSLKNYTRAITDSGGLPVALHVGESETDIEKSLKEMQGLLLPGGNDINSKLFNEASSGKEEYVDDALDEFEFRLLRAAQERRIPVLGICRSLQVINVYKGGSLYQDIPSQLGTKVAHRVRKDGKSQPNSHDITLYGTLEKLYGKNRLTVNSYHHQGVKALGKGLRVLAKADDGVVEAFENTEGAYIFAAQFHPEKEPDNPDMKLLLNKYFEAVRKNTPVK